MTFGSNALFICGQMGHNYRTTSHDQVKPEVSTRNGRDTRKLTGSPSNFKMAQTMSLSTTQILVCFPKGRKVMDVVTLLCSCMYLILVLYLLSSGGYSVRHYFESDPWRV